MSLIARCCPIYCMATSGLVTRYAIKQTGTSFPARIFSMTKHKLTMQLWPEALINLAGNPVFDLSAR